MKWSVFLLLIGCAPWIADIDPKGAHCVSASDCSGDFVCYQGYCLQLAEVCDQDGLTEVGEACDDGNARNDDGCTNTCRLAVCGDGIVRSDLQPQDLGYEACEPGANDHGYCSSSCQKIQRPQRLTAHRSQVNERRNSCLHRGDEMICWGKVRMAEVPDRPIDRPWFFDNAMEPTSIYDSGGYMILRESSGLAFVHYFQAANAFPMFLRAPLPIIGLAGGAGHDCAIKKERNELWCWGRNSCGEIAPSSDETRFIDFQRVEGRDGPLRGIHDIAVSSWSSCAVHDNGDVDCWGGRSDGQETGDCNRRGGYDEAWVVEASEISANAQTFVARRFDGSVVQWSGIWDRAFQAERREVTLPEPAVQVASADQTHCVVLASGRVACWGALSGAQPSDEPQIMPGLSAIVEISDSLTAEHICARNAEDEVWCWGDNSNGQLGDGTTDNRMTPEPVRGLDDPER